MGGKLFVMKGLPGSGKSTYAKELVAKDGNMIRVNRDDLRNMLHGDAGWSKERERKTLAAEQAIVEDALGQGYNVVVDDTNILGKGTAIWQSMVCSLNEQWDDDNCMPIRFEVVDMTKAPWAGASIEECIRRDAQRNSPARVGRGVIERMALFGELIDLSKEANVAVFDIDGTLSNLDHRLRFLNETPKDYDSFFKHVRYDGIFQTVWNAMYRLSSLKYFIIILSGRPSSCADGTMGWFNYWMKNHMAMEQPVFRHLFMRQAGDHRPDDQVKRELMNAMFEKAGLRKEAIKVIIDDRDSVCAVWREMGLPLLQVDHGNIIQIEPSAFRMAQMLQIPINSDNLPSDQDKPAHAE